MQSRSKSKLLKLGVGRVALFNWPKYVVAILAIVGLAIVVGASSGILRLLAALVAMGLVYGVVVSLVVTWWIYDRSVLSRWQWPKALVPSPCDNWALVHAGFDEARGRIDNYLGTPAFRIDVSSLVSSESGSLNRARRWLGLDDTQLVDLSFPIADASLDAVIVAFAAHEVRDPRMAAQLFEELRRVTKQGGSIILAEHCLDLPNVLVYGPAAWHFQTFATWQSLAESVNLEIASVQRLTPFVRGIQLCRA